MSCLSEQDRADLTEAVIYDGTNGGDRATFEAVEQIVARHVAAALTEAADAIEAERPSVSLESHPIGDAELIGALARRGAFNEAALIVRDRIPKATR